MHLQSLHKHDLPTSRTGHTIRSETSTEVLKRVFQPPASLTFCMPNSTMTQVICLANSSPCVTLPVHITEKGHLTTSRPVVCCTGGISQLPSNSFDQFLSADMSLVVAIDGIACVHQCAFCSSRGMQHTRFRLCPHPCPHFGPRTKCLRVVYTRPGQVPCPAMCVGEMVGC